MMNGINRYIISNNHNDSIISIYMVIQLKYTDLFAK